MAGNDKFTADEQVDGFEYGNEPATISNTEYTVLGWNPTEAGNDTDYTDGYGNHLGSITTKGKPSCSLTLQGAKIADMKKLKIGQKFTYDGYEWKISSIAKSRAPNSATQYSLTLTRGKEQADAAGA